MSILSLAQAPAMERLLTGDELAALFVVDPKTVRRWARDGLIKSIVTPGGRLRRYNPADVRPLLQAEQTAQAVSA